jgi:ribosomal protein S10
VRGTLSMCRQGGRIASALGFKDQLFRPMGPHPLADTFGMGAAVIMLQQSLAPGKYDKCMQFASVRKFRSAFSNVYHVTAEGQEAMVLAKDVRKMTVTKCPTYGEFFERFMRGMHKRMGEITRPDRAISLDIMLELQRMLEMEWLNHDNDLAVAMEASFYLVAFCCALRGEEVPLADLHGTLKYWEEGEVGNIKHVVIPLLGRFKGETGESYHLLCAAAVTDHGLEPRKWIGRLIQLLQNSGVRNGPLFRSPQGQRLRANHFEPNFISRLEYIQEMKSELIVSNVDVGEEYGVSRSFRRGATSEAVNNGVKPDVIDANNRWRKMNQAGASRPALNMREHYTDVRLTLKHRLIFSQAL